MKKLIALFATTAVASTTAIGAIALSGTASVSYDDNGSTGGDNSDGVSETSYDADLAIVGENVLIEKSLFKRTFIEKIINLGFSKCRLSFAAPKNNKINTKYLIKSYLKHPIMTFKIIIAIHYEAFKLWLKGIKFIKKKIKIKNNITFEN